MNRELRNILKANINFATMLCLGAPTTELYLGNVSLQAIVPVRVNTVIAFVHLTRVDFDLLAFFWNAGIGSAKRPSRFQPALFRGRFAVAKLRIPKGEKQSRRFGFCDLLNRDSRVVLLPK